MTLRRQLLFTFLIQGFGALSIFVATAAIGWSLGPAAQGVFSRLKSELEFVSAAALCGMPQAVFFYANSRRLERRRAISASLVLTAAGGAAALVYGWCAGHVQPGLLAVFGFAAAMIVLHSMLRVLVLADSTVRQFNIVTAAPQFALVLAVVALLACGALTELTTLAAFLLAYALGCLVAARMRRNTAVAPAAVAGAPVRTTDLVGFGLASWSVAILNSGATVFWLRYIESNAGRTVLGIFAMGLTLVQATLTPVNYASPLLFKRWMLAPGRGSGLRSALLVAAGVWAIMTAAVLAGRLPGVNGLLADYRALLGLGTVLAAIAASEAIVRMLAVSANARGRPWLPAVAELFRVAVLGVGARRGGGDPLGQVALWWMFGSFAAAALLAAMELVGPRSGSVGATPSRAVGE